MINHAELMTQAAMLRERLGEDNNSPVDIFAIAQGIDSLTIVFFPMGDNLSGMCVKGQESKLIAINSSMTLGRQRFSLAHEFYHLYYDDNMLSICAKTTHAEREVEKSADVFASYFLMPEPALIMQVERLIKKHKDQYVTLNDVIRIEQYFGVSHQATVYRLMQTRYLRDDDGNAMLCEAVRKRAEAIGFSSELYLPSPEGKKYLTLGNYINQAQELFSKGLISNGKYEELLLDAFREDLVYGDNDEEGDMID